MYSVFCIIKNNLDDCRNILSYHSFTVFVKSTFLANCFWFLVHNVSIVFESIRNSDYIVCYNYLHSNYNYLHSNYNYLHSNYNYWHSNYRFCTVITIICTVITIFCTIITIICTVITNFAQYRTFCAQFEINCTGIGQLQSEKHFLHLLIENDTRLVYC